MAQTQGFKKTQKQKQATALMASPQRHTMLFGGSRSGKTFNIVRAIIIRMCKVKSRHISLRQTFNSAKTSIWMDTLPTVLNVCFPDLKVEWNRSDFFIKTPNGSEYFIGGLDDAKRVEKHLGKEFSTVHFNECSQLSHSAVQMLLTRLAEKNDLAKKAYYDQNPPAKSHWTYWQFVKKLNPADAEPLKDPENYASMIMNPIDNLENIDSEYLSMLESLPEKERNRFLHGLFTESDDGQVYYEFRRDSHVSDTRRTSGTVFCGMDFNVDPMTCVFFQQVNNEWHVLDEIFLRNSDTYKMASEIEKRGYSGCTIIPDSTGKNRKTSGKSDFDILKGRGFKILPTRNPFVTDRTNNVNRLLAADKIKISPRCKKLINDLEKVAWMDNKLNQKGENKLLTHISDCLGYGLWALDKIELHEKKIITLR